MGKLYKTSLFIFRRDLRLEDNTGLIFALKNSETVICSFIFTPEQITKNAYKSNHALQFMIESLEELTEEIKKSGGKLYLFYGDPKEVVESCIEKLKIDGVVFNKDYTPYSVKRDSAIEAVCKKHEISFHSFEDVLLHPIEETLKSDGSQYKVFTPFFRNAVRMQVIPPIKNRYENYYSKPISFAEKTTIYSEVLPERALEAKGGRDAALKILKGLSKFSEYENERDFPAYDATTHLSAHLKFTTISPREAYYAIAKKLGEDSPLIRSLYWRDFFTSIAFFSPHVFGHSFYKKFDKLSWSTNKKDFARWCQGETGFPIVDAGMRELNQTGYMHNRVRMIAAAFLIKDLHIDWRMGEKYFAQNLIDYDPAVNNGNWQWAASTGCDAQPYFRIFNPWSQQKRFDPECTYIKRWIPELESLSPDAIHKWHSMGNELPLYDYPAPMLDHSEEAKITLESYKKI